MAGLASLIGLALGFGIVAFLLAKTTNRSPHRTRTPLDGANADASWLPLFMGDGGSSHSAHDGGHDCGHDGGCDGGGDGGGGE